MRSAAKKVWRTYRTAGAAGLYRRILWKGYLHRWNKDYQRWITQFDTVTEADRIWMREQIAAMRQRPLISVLMPVYNVDEAWLRKAIDSVMRQTYPYWELCIADDNSPSPHVRAVLREYADRDERIKIVFRPENGHISAASNSALELVTGQFVALLDHDDELAEHALFMVAQTVNAHPGVDMIYSDEDLIDTRGRRYFPKFKPNWSEDLFHSLNLITHLSCYRTEILRRIGGFRIGMEGSQDYDLALRFVEQISPGSIHHISAVLYHWRAIEGSVALAAEEKPYAHSRAREAITEHFRRTGTAARSERGFGELHRTVYELQEPRPLVSVITSADPSQIAGVRGEISRVDHGPLELVAVGAGSVTKVLPDGEVVVSDCPARPHFSMLNAAAAAATGAVLVFMDASTKTGASSWLTELTGFALQAKIGAVGARITFPDNRIKNAGLILGVGSGIARAHFGFHKDDLGNFMRLHVAQNFSAVSAECMAVRREVFEQAAGFDAETFPNWGADIDFCLRLLASGYRNAWTPWSMVVQASEPVEVEADALGRLKAKWPRYFTADPYYNPNFSDSAADFRLSFPPRRPVFGRTPGRSEVTE